jgi:cytochrome c5
MQLLCHSGIIIARFHYRIIMLLFTKKHTAFFLGFLLFFFQNLYAETHKPQQFLDSTRGKADEGSQIVQHYCVICHGKEPLVLLGAPTIDEDEAWQPRLKQGIDVIFEHTDNGLNAMPARGGCFECTDQQLMLAIFSLIPKKDQKALAETLKDSKKHNELKKILENTKLIHNSPDN